MKTKDIELMVQAMLKRLSFKTKVVHAFTIPGTKTYLVYVIQQSRPILTIVERWGAINKVEVVQRNTPDGLHFAELHAELDKQLKNSVYQHTLTTLKYGWRHQPEYREMLRPHSIYGYFGRDSLVPDGSENEFLERSAEGEW